MSLVPCCHIPLRFFSFDRSRRGLSVSSICNSRLVLMTKGRRNDPFLCCPIEVLSLSFHYLINIMELFLEFVAVPSICIYRQWPGCIV